MSPDPMRADTAPSPQLVLIAPVLIGAIAIVACVTVLPALAGPHILPEAKATRYATGIWLFHIPVFLVMGYAGAGGGGPRLATVSTCVATAMGAVAGLFYTQAGILPASATTIAGMAALALALGLLGALAGWAAPGFTGWAVTGLVLCGFVALAVAFLRTGAVSGIVTRPVQEITFGMVTALRHVPVPDIPVVLATPDGETRLYETKTGETGRYVFNGPRPGRYMLFVRDLEPGRGDGAWVSAQVTVHSHLSGRGLGAGAVSLPMHEQEQPSPFLEAPGHGAPVLPGAPG